MPTADQREAEEIYKSFYNKDDVDWTEPVGLTEPFPCQWGYAGECVTTYYLSNKWQDDPNFYERYYHDHKRKRIMSKGVGIWLPEGSQPWLTDKQPTKKVAEPPKAVAALAYSFGFDIKRPGQKKVGRLDPDPGSMLVSSPEGKRLYVLEDIANKGGKLTGKITALIWGPSLRVEARGIVG